MTRHGPFSPRGRFGDPLSIMRQEFNRMAEEFGRFAAAPPAQNGGVQRMALARADMSETDDALYIEIEAPGVDDRGLDLELRGDVLTIRAMRESRHDTHDRNWHVRERAMSGVSRALTLPFAPDPDAISAHLENGVLHVEIAKVRDPAARRVKIPIGAAPAAGAPPTAQAAPRRDAPVPKGAADPAI